MKKEYNEAQKNVARDKAFKFAIRSLTTNRYKSTIARKSYVQDVKNYLRKEGSESDRGISSKLTRNEIRRWETFYKSIVRKRRPSELRVAYLSGPNPENDIEVLVKYGILPENIWAFESDIKTYSKAIIAALDSKFPLVKIYRGKIEKYLKLLPFKFDIIYLDFCSTVASEQTVSVIRDIFLYQKLETLGILITNFALPSAGVKENQEYRERLALLAANYLYPKPFTEELSNLGGGFIESAECCGISHENFLEMAKRNLETFYSQFITRLLYDLPSVIIPYQRLAHNPFIINLFFKEFNDKIFSNDYHEDLLTFPNDNSLVWGLSNFFVEMVWETSGFSADKNSFDNLFDRLKRQLSIDSDEKKLLEQIEIARYLLSESAEDNLHSEKLEKIRANWGSFSKYIFCDVFLFHQLKDILVGQLTSPHFYNAENTRRWMYKAKETEMFMDLITYDECRYVFDWMPTLDMFEEGVEDWNRQLSLRFAMDSISKQRRWYNDEFFAGTAVIGQDRKSFEAKELKKRKIIR